VCYSEEGGNYLVRNVGNDLPHYSSRSQNTVHLHRQRSDNMTICSHLNGYLYDQLLMNTSDVSQERHSVLYEGRPWWIYNRLEYILFYNMLLTSVQYSYIKKCRRRTLIKNPYKNNRRYRVITAWEERRDRPYWETPSFSRLDTKTVAISLPQGWYSITDSRQPHQATQSCKSFDAALTFM
jgi:hypothetical protein